MSIACLGEALIELRSDKHLTENLELSASISGLTAKVSMELARLGLNVNFFGAVGNDVFGEIIVKTLSRSRVNVEGVVRKNLRTTILIVLGGNVKIYFRKPHFNSADTELTLNDICLDKVLSNNALFSSALSLTENPLKHTVLYLAKYMLKSMKETFLHVHPTTPYILDFKELLNDLKHFSHIMFDIDYAEAYGITNPKSLFNIVYRKNPSVKEVSLIYDNKIVTYSKEQGKEKITPNPYGKTRNTAPVSYTHLTLPTN